MSDDHTKPEDGLAQESGGQHPDLAHSEAVGEPAAIQTAAEGGNLAAGSDCTINAPHSGKVSKAPAKRPAEKAERRPIICTKKHVRSMSDESMQALANKAPGHRLFQQHGRLVRVRDSEFGVVTEELTEDALRGALDRCGEFLRSEKEDRLTPARVPLDVVRDILSLPKWPQSAFPKLKSVITVPVFTSSGRLIEEAGYDVESQLWFQPPPGFRVPKVPEKPTEDDLDQAKRLLTLDLLGDFPFEGDADRANAFALLMTPFAQELFEGRTPLFAIDSPTPGTGKGLLCKAVTMPFLGRELAFSPQPESDAEWRKVITSQLQKSSPVIAFDNVRGAVNSPSLEAALTATVWEDRILGSSKVASVNNRTLFMVTGNNLNLSGDLARRVVWIRLDAKSERPEERPPTSFRHPDLARWIMENRGELVWAICVFIRNWFNHGRLGATATMASFESWAATGGIMGPYGDKNFLQNRDTNRAANGDDSEQWFGVCYYWWQKHGSSEVVAKDIYMVVEAHELLPWLTGNNETTTTGKRQRLGHQLKNQRGRVYGGYRIVDTNEYDTKSSKIYKLEWTGGEPVPPTGEVDDAPLASRSLEDLLDG